MLSPLCDTAASTVQDKWLLPLTGANRNRISDKSNPSILAKRWNIPAWKLHFLTDNSERKQCRYQSHKFLFAVVKLNESVFKTTVNNLPNDSEISALFCASVTALISLEISLWHRLTQKSSSAKPHMAHSELVCHTGAESLKWIKHLGNKITSTLCMCVIAAHRIRTN